MRAPRRIAIKLDLDWPYKRHAEVFAGTQKYAEEQGWHSIIDEYAHDTLSKIKSKSKCYDGIIARANYPLVKQAKRLKIPLVNVWGASPAREGSPGVFPDYSAVGRQCAEHLLSRGFRNFGTLVSPNNYPQDRTVRAFEQVVNEAGFACLKDHYPQHPHENTTNWRKTQQTLEHCIATWPTPIGLYVSQEIIGRMVVQISDERGLSVPADVAIIAGQNEDTLCKHPRPTLTSMEIGFERVGYEAARLLHTLMDGKTNTNQHVYIPPIGVIVRESTDFFAVEDPLVAAALSFISANCHHPISQDDVAQAVATGTRTLQNRFRQFLKRPIATEIRRVRIERAKRELSQSKNTMQEIARNVGFGEAMRMYEVFCREIGMTPTEYRKKLQASRADSNAE